MPKEGEPWVLAEDRAWLEALLAEQRDTHGPCGQPKSESFDPATWGKYTLGPGVKCNACLAIEQRAKRDDGSVDESLYFSVHLRHD